MLLSSKPAPRPTDRKAPAALSALAALARLPAGRFTKWLVLAAWVAIIVVAFPLAGKLSAEDGNPAEGPRGAQSTEVAQLAGRFPDGKIETGIVVYVREGGITAADRAKAGADRQSFAPLATERIPPPEPSIDTRL